MRQGKHEQNEVHSDTMTIAAEVNMPMWNKESVWTKPPEIRVYGNTESDAWYCDHIALTLAEFDWLIENAPAIRNWVDEHDRPESRTPVPRSE